MRWLIQNGCRNTLKHVLRILHAAFEDSAIQGVIASIGGAKSIGLILYLDLKAIASND